MKAQWFEVNKTAFAVDPLTGRVVFISNPDKIGELVLDDILRAEPLHCQTTKRIYFNLYLNPIQVSLGVPTC